MSESATGGSLYARIGGAFAVQAAAELFYEKVLADPLLAPFFVGLDMERQVRKQTAFLTWAFQGPVDEGARDLAKAHRRVVHEGAGDAHFDAVLRHLRETLEELEIPRPLIGEVLLVLEGTRKSVLRG